eukprot:TRINITY_DN73262_c0_g1_i1.p1 TRINITY_DN73262_c0_g1~~TRINITY_DN73262_c0_g1_i1.p1  ORF type:complete len:1017 (+),score=168.41 TRINITY_DN73262_c0_g1_i1:127-3177(+)
MLTHLLHWPACAGGLSRPLVLASYLTLLWLLGTFQADAAGRQTVQRGDFQMQQGEAAKLPGGPWIKNARDITYFGHKLCAKLQKADGSRGAKTCVFVQAGQEFRNDDGKFAIMPRRQPGGTWAQSARNIKQESRQVCAEVRKLDGSWTYQCAVADGDIFYMKNDDGILRRSTPPCDTLPQCLLGYVHRPGGNETYCAGLKRCDPVVDRDTCCEPAEPCMNVSWCEYGFVPMPGAYCPTVRCDPVRDYDHCCKPEGSCSNMQPLWEHVTGRIYSCLKGTSGRPNASEIRCDRPVCNNIRHAENCCEDAAPCGNLSRDFGPACDYGFYFNLDDFCDGPVCQDWRDRGKCCQAAERCWDNYTCPYGYLPKNESQPARGIEDFCDGERPNGYYCEEELDLLNCCDPAMSCMHHTCPHGTFNKPGFFCANSTCEEGDTDDCCDPAAICATWDIELKPLTGPNPRRFPGERNCPRGKYFNDNAFCAANPCENNTRDRGSCCEPAAACATLGYCPYSYNFKVNLHTHYCYGPTCIMERDRDLCCDPAAACEAFPYDDNATSPPCPFGYVQKENVSTQLHSDAGGTMDVARRRRAFTWTEAPMTIYCLGTSCELARDRDVCCDVAMPCAGNFVCPHGYTAKLLPAFCDGTVCDTVRDRDFCCEFAAPCEDVTCEAGWVHIPDRYCGGMSCMQDPGCIHEDGAPPCNNALDRDYYHCCERGLPLKYYRWSPTMVRYQYSDAVQAQEIYFYHRQFATRFGSTVTCRNRDDGARDTEGDHCIAPRPDPPSVWCGATDDVDFSANDMCCECISYQGNKVGGQRYSSFVEYGGVAYATPGNYPLREAPEFFIDDDPPTILGGPHVATKWLDFDGSPITIRMDGMPMVIDSYAWRTANDEPKRDPIRWRLEGSEDGVDWVLLHEIDEEGGEQATGTDAFGYTTEPTLVPQLPRQTVLDTMWINMPCLSPQNVTHALSPSCAEGNVLEHAELCTPQCEHGYVPSVGALNCSMGVTSPYTFQCVVNQTGGGS